ncbi:MAG TPA: helix-turn-helix domain-containing protein, partial [Micromonosporaceae bacterium]|jgi:DNA-binding transcriptional ArsR family regulator
MTDVRGPSERRPSASAAERLRGASLPEGDPSWFDPTQDAILTPGRLRGLVHPIRLQLLTLLQDEGPATASQLGRRIGHSSGVTSYHLRILAQHGFVDEDAERGNGRDRYWRSHYRATHFTFRSTEDPGDAETVELAEQFMRMVADTYYERMVRYVDTLVERRAELSHLPWTLSTKALRLSEEEARELARDVMRLLEHYDRRDVPERDGAVDATFQFQMLPDDDPVRS